MQFVQLGGGGHTRVQELGSYALWMAMLRNEQDGERKNPSPRECPLPQTVGAATEAVYDHGDVCASFASPPSYSPRGERIQCCFECTSLQIVHMCECARAFFCTV